ncbi:MAG: FIST N-terminal domain-containing protein [Bacteroidota bacterium]
MKALSFSTSSPEDLKSKMTSALSEINPTIGIAFSDPDFKIEAAVELFSELGIQLFGCTTSGEICNRKLVEKSFTLLLVELPEDSFLIHSIDGTPPNYIEPGAVIGNKAAESFENPAILVYSAGVGVDGESIVKGIKSGINKEIPIYGGLGGDNFKHENIRTFTDQVIRKNGLAALIIDSDRVAVNGKTYSGWNELGKTHTITKAEGNVLLEVDDKPALDLFNKYFKGVEYRQNEGSEKLFTVPAIYPLKIKRENGVEFMRSTLIYDFERKALILAGAVKEGDRFKFCPTPSFDVVEATVEEFQRYAKRDITPSALIMNSCAARHFAFGPMFDDEVEGIFNIWKKPMIGYMAYGEIGNTMDDEHCEFHNVTCSIVFLSENRQHATS